MRLSSQETVRAAGESAFDSTGYSCCEEAPARVPPRRSGIFPARAEEAAILQCQFSAPSYSCSMVFTSVSFAFRAWSGLPGLHRRYVDCQPHLFADPRDSESISTNTSSHLDGSANRVFPLSKSVAPGWASSRCGLSGVALRRVTVAIGLYSVRLSEGSDLAWPVFPCCQTAKPPLGWLSQPQ